MLFVVLFGFLVFYTSLLPPTTSLIAFDCGSSNNNHTIINIKSLIPCKSSEKQVEASSVNIQLLEMSEMFKATVFNCLVEVTRVVMHCGMHSHNSLVAGGFASYVYTLGRDACVDAVKTGRVFLHLDQNNIQSFHDLSAGSSYHRSITFAGNLDSEGSCKGSAYTDKLGSWNDVVVSGSIKVTINKYDASVNGETNKIHLQSGTSCKYSDGKCLDSSLGESYWNVKEDDTCKTLQYKVLYEGNASISYSEDLASKINSNIEGTLLTVSNDMALFSFKLGRRYRLCHLEAYTTDHPRLLVIRQLGTSFYHKQQRLDGTELDLFSYINSKFVYIERHLETNLKTLHRYIEHLICEAYVKSLENNLALAYIDPNEFAYLYNKGPGTTGTVLGEVIYITKCTPVIVRKRKTEHCYKELPVTYGNQTLFMTPKHHTLVKRGNEITCNTIMPPLYELEGSWWQLQGQPYTVPAPQELDPNTKNKWTYVSPGNLASAGIYTLEDLEQLRDHIMNGHERNAITTILGRGFSGQNPDYQGGSVSNLLTEDTLNSVGERLGRRLWGLFSVFGNLSSGVIGIIIVIRIVKWIADTVIHGRALYEVYGWSIKLVASGWDSLTICLLSKHRVPANSDTLNETKNRNTSSIVEMSNLEESHQMIQDEIPASEYSRARHALARFNK